MELFRGRYLCFISFLFLLFAFVAFNLSFLPKLFFLIFLFIAVFAGFLTLVFNKRHRFGSLIVFLSIFAIFLSVSSSFVFVSIPQKRAEELPERFEGEVRVVSKEYGSESGSEYYVRLIEANGEKIDIKSYLVCAFDSDFSVGDKLMLTLDSEIADKGYGAFDRDTVLYLEADTSEKILFDRADDYGVFSLDAFRVFTRGVRQSLCEYIDGVFGADSALVKGMLINDRSDLSEHTRAQFSRAGASHLLAVSGLHVSLILGALELLLRKFFAPKKLRIAIITVFGFIFLALTDFSASAVRSVFMLFGVYLSFLFSEENDAPTALFVSVSLIVLLSPHSISDIGMWLSFFATLGLVVVYPVLEKKLWRPKSKKGILNKILSLGMSIVRALLLTGVATFFTLPIMYCFFGSFSIASLPANVLLSPMTAVFLPLCLIALILGKIAYVGNAAVFCAGLVGRVIISTVSFFADLRGALISLRFPFAFPLVVLFALSLAVLLVVKLKRKIFVALPAVCFVAGFAVCLGVFTLIDKPEISYVGRRDNELVFVECAGTSSICDVSTGYDGAYSLLKRNLCEYSTEIENYVITHLHKGHAQMIERICANMVIRRLYIPLEAGGEALEYAKSVLDVAEKYGSEVVFYESGEKIKLLQSISLHSFYEERENGEAGVFFSIFGKKDSFTYSDASMPFEISASEKMGGYLMIGTHGDEPKTAQNNWESISERGIVLIFADQKRAQKENVDFGYSVRKQGSERKISIDLH